MRASQQSFRTDSEGLEWALSHQDVIAAAVVKVLDVDAVDVYLEVVQVRMPSKRRLSATYDDGIVDDHLFHLRLSIADPSADATAIMDMLLGRDSQSGLAETITVLVGEPLVELVAVDHARLVESFVLPDAIWLIGDWSACAECGEGYQVRNVSCASGNRLACDVGSPMPDQRQTCLDYNQCSFDVSCPLGRGSSIGCVSQAGMMLGPMGLLCMCIFARILQLGCRRPESGLVTVAGLRMRFAYKVERAAHPASPSKEDTLSNLEAGGHAVEFDKVRITWNIDMPKVQQWFERDATCEEDRRRRLGEALPWVSTSDDCFAESALVGSTGPERTAPVATWCKSDDRATSKDKTFSATESGSTGIGDDVYDATSPKSLASQSISLPSPSIPWSSVVVSQRSTTMVNHRVELSDEDLEDRIEGKLCHSAPALLTSDLSPRSSPVTTWQRRLSKNTPLAATVGDSQAASCTGFKIFYAYEEGDLVEYYSATLARWVQAVIHPERVGDGDVNYNLTLSFGRQTRSNVPLESLRLPFKDCESIEMFSMRDGGTWLPAVVCGQLGSTNTTLGYTVKLCSGFGTIDRVPALRLRRRFEPGDVVSVYRGPALGWMSTKVHFPEKGTVVKPQSVLDDDTPDPELYHHWYSPAALADLSDCKRSSKLSSRGNIGDAVKQQMLDHQVNRLLFNGQSNAVKDIGHAQQKLPSSIVDAPPWPDVLIMSTHGVHSVQRLEYVKSYLLR